MSTDNLVTVTFTRKQAQEILRGIEKDLYYWDGVHNHLPEHPTWAEMRDAVDRLHAGLDEAARQARAGQRAEGSE